MAGSADWSTITAAGAFVLGAALATLATIRVVRAVITLFDSAPTDRPRRRWGRSNDRPGTDTHHDD